LINYNEYLKNYLNFTEGVFKISSFVRKKTDLGLLGMLHKFKGK